MNDLIREQCFCQWVISKILALYITQEDFRNEVDSKLNDGYSFSINGEKMGEYEQAEWKLSMVCVDIAKQFTEYYFKELWGDEFEAEEDEPQTGEMMTEEEFDSMLARALTGNNEPQTERSE